MRILATIDWTGKVVVLLLVICILFLAGETVRQAKSTVGEIRDIAERVRAIAVVAEDTAQWRIQNDSRVEDIRAMLLDMQAFRARIEAIEKATRPEGDGK